MIKDQIQKQDGGENSNNYQAGNSIIFVGLSYPDYKQISEDVCKSYEPKYAQIAKDVATERVNEFTNNFFERLQKENPQANNELIQPGMQSALFEAQKQYAKTGDKDLEELLIDLLIRRTTQRERDIYQIVLDEAIKVTEKLTIEQMDILTINFLLSKTKANSINNLDSLVLYLDTEIIPFLSDLRLSSSCFEHLEYAGCGSLLYGPRFHDIEHIFRTSYPGLFSKGFDQERFITEIGNSVVYKDFVIPCLHDQNRTQFNTIDTTILNEKLSEKNIPKDIQDRIISLFNNTLMNEREIRDFLINKRPQMEILFNIWEKSSISKFSLTTVGIAIAHANYRRKIGNKIDLSLWIK